MYPSIHSLAHRAPPATRTRVRWQPYNSLPTSASASSLTSRSPSSTYLNTPTSSVSSSPSPTPTLPCDSERTKQPQQRELSQSRDKNKYALSLVDQAVKSLGEIWLPQDIPVVFLTSSRAMVPGADNSPLNHNTQHSTTTHPSPCLQRRNTQLPSPISPTTHPSPLPSTQCNESVEALLNPRNNVPVRGFVHEVLRRSRTSGTVLQTALCYLEAIRPKIPELLRQEKSGEGCKGELELDSRITPATEAELELESQSTDGSSCGSEVPTLVVNDAGDDMDTVKVSDSDSDIDCADAPTNAVAYGLGNVVPQSVVGDDALKKSKGATAPLAPLPPLPSPLLCPRRAFLASLILASKFTQDKCYSNRAWAKLSGLPPREIGRCERALGDALEWRLWVGKTPACSSPSSSSTPSCQAAGTPASSSACGSTRPVARCQSEGNLRSTASERTPFLVSDMSPADQKVSPVISKNSPVMARPLMRRAGSGLRRASTLPAEAFSSSSPAPSSLASQYMTSRVRSNNVVTQWIINNQGQLHAEQVDQEMYSPETDGSRPEHEASASTNHSSTAIPMNSSTSPYPPTPGLSYSPSTTESSLESGDRTIQMSAFSSFEDGSMTGSFGSVGSFNPSAFIGGCGGTSNSTAGCGPASWTNASLPAGSCAIGGGVDFNLVLPGTHVSSLLNLEHQTSYLDGYNGWSTGIAPVGTMVI
ncbi:hypothetical protein PQX77_018476 [Marasmius sp. AFHP31]|nr:hypothetical protein PQX77_018476 [Marasmius sp. AFHP31]